MKASTKPSGAGSANFSKDLPARTFCLKTWKRPTGTLLPTGNGNRKLWHSRKA